MRSLLCVYVYVFCFISCFLFVVFFLGGGGGGCFVCFFFVFFFCFFFFRFFFLLRFFGSVTVKYMKRLGKLYRFVPAS